MLQTPRCAAVLILSFALLARAQQATQNTNIPRQSNLPLAGGTPQLVPRSEEDRSQASRDSHEILLNVLVTDAAGKAVGGLAENNFTIRDQGKPQPITFFRPAQPPHVILLLDAVNGSHGSYAAERKAVEKFLTDRDTPLAFPVAVGWLSASGIIRVNPESQDPKTLLSQVQDASSVRTWTDSEQQTAQDMGGISGGQSHIGPYRGGISGVRSVLGPADKSRRFVLSVDALTHFALNEKNVPGRVVVLWLGVGWPLLAGPGFFPDTAETKQGFFDRITNLSNDLRDAQMTLNAVASPESLLASGLTKNYYAPFLPAVTAPSQASAANLALPVLAVQSGGEVLDRDKDMASAIAESLAGINSWYMLAFQSLPSSQPDEYRPLQVTVNRPGVVVRTNAGYYAQP